VESRRKYKAAQNFDKTGFGVYDVSIKSKEASNMMNLQKWADQYLIACKYQKGLDSKTSRPIKLTCPSLSCLQFHWELT